MALANEKTLGFLGRLCVSSAVLGSVFALVAVGTSAVSALLARENLRMVDEPVRRQIPRNDLFTPVEQRIRDHEAMIDRLKDPVAIAEENRNLAVLYEELGKRSFEFAQLPRSEEAYQKCLALDPDNPRYLSDLAQLYATAAVRQEETRQKLTLLRNSSRCWESAATNTPDAVQKREYQQGAASALMGAAKELTIAGLSNEARRELERARSLAPIGSAVAHQIDSMLDQSIR
jgi:tetratricopeptide (TPR) repeat protein